MAVTTWRCPKCAQTVTLHVTPSAPPVCARHTGGRTVMNQTKQETMT